MAGANGGSEPTYIYTSTDFGSAWTPSSFPSGTQTLSSVACPSSLDCVAVGDFGYPSSSIIASADAGGSWTSQAVPTGTHSLNSVSCPADDDCIAVGENTSGTALVVSDDPPVPAFGITTTSLPDGSVYNRTNKLRYSATLAADAGNPPYKWSLAPGSTLPPGLKLSSKGVISGKATTAGTYPFTIQVVDTKTKTKPKTQNSATAALSITIT
jgi:hypothetical protein